MNPETKAWEQLHNRAAAQLPSGFADRVLRAARAAARPSFGAQFALSAATAVLCFLAVALFNAHSARTEGENSLAGWQELASVSDEMGQVQ